MHLAELRLQNFRGIEDLSLTFDEFTVLIGQNNTGKSSILDALHICMSRSLARKSAPFAETDFHLKDSTIDRYSLPKLVLTLTYSERVESEWSAQIDQIFGDVIQLSAVNKKSLKFRIISQYDKDADMFGVSWTFLNLEDFELSKVQGQQIVSDLQRIAPVYLLGAVREASDHFRPQSSFWGLFSKNSPLTDGEREEFEKQFQELNDALVSGHLPFETVKQHISRAAEIVDAEPEGFANVEILPSRLTDLLSRSQVKIATPGGARLPAALHGSGTQSMSVLFLFAAFLDAGRQANSEIESYPILALEEPEARLHPSAIRSLWATIAGLEGQKVIASHSGDFLSAVPLMAIRRLARKNGKVEVFSIGEGTLTEDEINSIEFHVKSSRGSLLFAKAWLLVEGEADFVFMTEIAQIVGNDLASNGVVCVPFANCGLRPLLKVAKELGIESVLLVDGDSEGERTVALFRQCFSTDDADSRIFMFNQQDIEHCMWAEGYEQVYESNVTFRQRSTVTVAAGSSEYVDRVIDLACKSKGKPTLARLVCKAIRSVEIPGVPDKLNIAISRCVELARS